MKRRHQSGLAPDTDIYFEGFLDYAKLEYDHKQVDEIKQVFRVFKVVAILPLILGVLCTSSFLGTL